MPALTRDYIVGALIENVEIALGRRRTTITRVVTSKDRDGLQTVEATSLLIYERDGATANRALELLAKELDRRERNGDRTADQSDAPAVKRNPELAEAIRRFRAAVRPPLDGTDGKEN